MFDVLKVWNDVIVRSSFVVYIFVYISSCNCILCIYSFIYLSLCIRRFVEGSIPLTNTWRDFDENFTWAIKSQIKIKQIKKLLRQKILLSKTSWALCSQVAYLEICTGMSNSNRTKLLMEFHWYAKFKKNQVMDETYSC